MSGTTEQEILDKYVDALGQARQSCMWLAQNADPERVAPRGIHYTTLKKALKELEGCCRQMSHWREDCRWLPMGILYAKAMRMSQRFFVAQKWKKFQDLAQLFELGQRRMQELQTSKTGRSGMILPARTDWLVLPDATPPPNIWMPQGRAMN